MEKNIENQLDGTKGKYGSDWRNWRRKSFNTCTHKKKKEMHLAHPEG